MKMMRTTWIGTMVGAVCAMAGCGGMAPPTHAQTDAVAAVRSAEAIGATDTPVASYQLELARGELDQAQTLMNGGHNEQARDVLDRAKADAELATALRREAIARVAATESRQHVVELREADDDVTSGGSTTPGVSTTTTTTTTRPQ